jgi:hypothetical protein
MIGTGARAAEPMRLAASTFIALSRALWPAK